MANRRTPYQGLFEELGVIKLTEVPKCATAAYVYRSLLNSWLNEFSFRTHARNTRQATQALFIVPNWSLTCSRNAIQYCGLAMYNEITIDIRQIVNYQNRKMYITDSRVQ